MAKGRAHSAYISSNLLTYVQRQLPMQQMRALGDEAEAARYVHGIPDFTHHTLAIANNTQDSRRHLN